MTKRDPIRWENGEQIIARSWAVPGIFVFVYAGVIGWLWLARECRLLWLRLRVAVGY